MAGIRVSNGSTRRVERWFVGAAKTRSIVARMRLSAGSASVEFDLFQGGRLSSLVIDGLELLVQPRDLAAPNEIEPVRSELDPRAWGCYPMVPWAGRVKEGLFSFDGDGYQLPIGLPPHAIHGTAYLQTWDPGCGTAAAHQADPTRDVDNDRGTESAPRSISECTAESSTVSGSITVNLDETWPFGGEVTQRAELSAQSLTLTLSVTAGERAMPVMVGWHPWFRRVLTTGRQQAELELLPGCMYELGDDSIPTGTLGPIPQGPWDNCFVDLQADPRITWPGQIELTLSSDCQYWVVYTEPEHALCVEPQSDAPDSFNRDPDRLEPGETFKRTFTLNW